MPIFSLIQSSRAKWQPEHAEDRCPEQVLPNVSNCKTNWVFGISRINPDTPSLSPTLCLLFRANLSVVFVIQKKNTAAASENCLRSFWSFQSLDWRSRVLKSFLSGPLSSGTIRPRRSGPVSQKQLGARITFAHWLTIEPGRSWQKDASGNPCRYQKDRQQTLKHSGSLTDSL